MTNVLHVHDIASALIGHASFSAVYQPRNNTVCAVLLAGIFSTVDLAR